MNHDDPLCTTVLNTEMSDAFCNCDVIARVREDEAQGQSEALLNAQRVFLREGYAAALRDAVEAVRLSPSADIELVERSQVISDIEALGGKR